MFIAFGTRFCGKIATVNNQWVESKFFSVMFIPIFPVSTMFVTQSNYRSRKGFQMTVNAQSVKAAYGRISSMAFSILFLFFAYGDFNGYGGGDITSGLSYLILGIFCATLCMYFYIYYARPSAEDILLRNKIGKLTGFYALPHWFSYPELRNILGSLELKYKQYYPGEDWKADLQSDAIRRDKHQLLFGLALFNCMAFDLPENDALYARADQLYTLKPENIVA